MRQNCGKNIRSKTKFEKLECSFQVGSLNASDCQEMLGKLSTIQGICYGVDCRFCFTNQFFFN